MNPIKKKIFELSLIHTHFASMLDLMEKELLSAKSERDQAQLIDAYRIEVRNYYKSCMTLKKELEKWFEYERDNDLTVDMSYRHMYKKIQGIKEPNI